ncbi:Nn.00g035480.m01.CDS01 [Neocucurbitaria sp. VM-36]
MLLPPELLTLLYLATTTTAFPQNGPQANSTAPPLEPTFDATNFDLVDLSATVWADCATTSCDAPLNFIPGLPTATGWEDDTNDLKPTAVNPAEQNDQVVTTRRPTVLNIETNIRPTITQSTPSNNGPGRANNNESEDKTAQPTSNPAPAPQQSERNYLLDNIVSRLGDAVSSAQTTQALFSVTGGGGGGGGDFTAQRQQAPATLGSITSGGADIIFPQATIAPGGVVTIESATLTLTPGLSTTVGSAADATFVGITTDSTGHTIITISSSGTAVTATVTDVAATVTLSKIGFDASITDVARPGVLTASTAAGVAASTSSKGAAGERSGEGSWWMGAVLGLGAVFAI